MSCYQPIHCRLLPTKIFRYKLRVLVFRAKMLHLECIFSGHFFSSSCIVITIKWETAHIWNAKKQLHFSYVTQYQVLSCTEFVTILHLNKFNNSEWNFQWKFKSTFNIVSNVTKICKASVCCVRKSQRCRFLLFAKFEQNCHDFCVYSPENGETTKTYCGRLYVNDEANQYQCVCIVSSLWQVLWSEFKLNRHWDIFPRRKSHFRKKKKIIQKFRRPKPEFWPFFATDGSFKFNYKSWWCFYNQYLCGTASIELNFSKFNMWTHSTIEHVNTPISRFFSS